MSTQIRGNKQIKNITIENDQITDSTIELNKLKEGAELFKRDGSVAATDNLNLDGNQIKNIGAPIDDNDAIRKVDLDELADRVGGTLINREIVGGVKDGENVTFTLANEPTLATEQIFLNGSLLNAGANADYSIAGNVITFTVAPQEGDAILANYIVDGIQLNVDVQATLAAFNGRLTTAEAELFDTEQAVVELGNDADILAGRVTTTENEISAVKVRATNIENNIDVVEADLSAEEARAMGAESALDARVGEAEIDIVGLTNRMLSAEGDINSLEAADVAMDSRVGNLEDGLQAETTARTTADNALNTRVTALENADTDVDARLDAVESDVAALEVDISSEAATRLANDNALQSNINGEIAARTAADSTLQSNINQEIANRIADVDAEEARAMAAESALDVRVTALEADPASQAYVDQKISDLVNSAPAVLDTLKELSDALGGDQNFATTISNQIGNVASNLSSEISRAQNAEAALDARIDELHVNLTADYASIAYVDAEVSAVDSKVDSLVADLAQEAIDRAADVDAEEARAMSAESALDARIETLENAPAPVTALSYLSDVTVTTPSNGQVLQYNGSEWVNGAAPSTFSGSYNDLTNKPALVQVAFSGSYNDLIQKPNFADVATSGSYADLNSKPDLSVYALDSDLSAVDARVEALENGAFVTREVPSGSVNGSNTVFTLANTPVAGTEQVFLNGLMQQEGAQNDYTISGSTITFTSAPDAGWKLFVNYATGNYTVAPGGNSGSSLTAFQWSSSEQVYPFEKDSDGSTLYCIEYNLGTVPVASSQITNLSTIQSGLLGHKIFRLECFGRATGYHIPIPLVYTASQPYEISVIVFDNKIEIRTSDGTWNSVGVQATARFIYKK